MSQLLQLNQWAGVLEVHINIRKHQGHLEAQGVDEKWYYNIS